MRQSIRAVVASLLVGVLITSCAAPAGTTGPTGLAPASTPPQPSVPGTREPVDEPGLAISAVARIVADPEKALLAAEAINELGFELLRTGTEAQENAVLSPASIVLALAMARAGARGATATEMDDVLRSVAAESNGEWLAALDAALAQRTGSFTDFRGDQTDVTLRITNAPFAQADYEWEAAYLDALAERFGAGVRLVDYIADAESARRAINGWVSEQTERRIPELLGDGAVDTATRLVLVNAIYLKASWLRQFQKAFTMTGPFHRLDGSTVDVPMMSGRVPATFAEGAGWFAVDVPYVGSQLSMLVLVPENLPDFEAELDQSKLVTIVEALEDQGIRLALPRFGIETSLSLNETLVKLGMPSAFDPRVADFTAMTAAERLFISDVVHQANIDVDETGTEAAAATAVIMEVVSLPRTVAIDRPFLFALRDRETGAILFLGRVVEPVER